MKAYHTTLRSKLKSILANGLKPDSGQSFTYGDWVSDFYGGMVPVFVALSKPWLKAETGMVVIELDIANLPLYLDVGCLIDHGAYADEIGGLWFKGKGIRGIPVEISNQEINESHLQSDLTTRVIKLTKTAAIKSIIYPSRIGKR